MINGSDDSLIKRPMVFDMDEFMRLPSVSRMCFFECGANTAMEWNNTAVPAVQYTHGMISCSEFTGVPLITLLEMCGADVKRGKFVLAEGADGSGMTRTIPMSLIQNGEGLVAYGQNGEMLRPENGYPLRLIVPGIQGVNWIKYLRRIEVGDKPYGTKDETLHYVDLLPDGTHRQYSSIQEVKSVITSPSGGQVVLQKGFHSITGLAWSGRGKVKKVDVSVDGGRNWMPAWRQERLSQQRDSIVAAERERRGQKCSSGLVLAFASCRCSWRPKPLNTPTLAEQQRRKNSRLGTLTFGRTSKACPKGRARLSKVKCCGKRNAHPATAALANHLRSSRRLQAEPQRTT